MNFQIIAIVILLVFYACYFCKMISQKKRGIRTDQMGKGKTGRAKFIEITLKTATLCVPIVEVISIVLNTSFLFARIRYAGVIFALSGDLIFICSVLTMRDSWRAGVSKTDKTELVTSGIYQISRNPAFLGFDLVYLSILLMFFNWILFVVSVFAAFMLHLQIVYVEEDFLITVFGKNYLDYSKKVKRYIGRKKGANS